MSRRLAVSIGLAIAAVGMIILVPISTGRPLVLTRVVHDTISEVRWLRGGLVLTTNDTVVRVACPVLATRVIHYPGKLAWTWEGPSLDWLVVRSGEVTVYDAKTDPRCVVSRGTVLSP